MIFEPFLFLAAIAEVKAEQERLSSLTEEEREKYLADKTAERRHRELCEAIRSTSFWRF